jgi:sigma-E processing peptidase SpoIIGA
MEVTLYADVLFLVNFTMDFLTLFTVGSLLRRRVKTLRLVLSSALGGAYGVASCFMGGPLIFRLLINLAVSVIMCHIAFEKRIMPVLAAFYGGGCLLGGMLTALYSLITTSSIDPSAFGRDGVSPSGDLPLGWTAVVASVMTVAVIAGGRKLKKRRDAFDVTVTVSRPHASVTLSGICDSGNLLREPLTDRAVIIVERNAFLSTLKSDETKYFTEPIMTEDTPLRSLRIIPCDSVGGHRILLGYIPESLSIDGRQVDCVLAMGECGFDGRQALVPSVLCK